MGGYRKLILHITYSMSHTSIVLRHVILSSSGLSENIVNICVCGITFQITHTPYLILIHVMEWKFNEWESDLGGMWNVPKVSYHGAIIREYERRMRERRP